MERQNMTFEEWFDANRGENTAKQLPVEIYNALMVAYNDGYDIGLDRGYSIGYGVGRHSTIDDPIGE